MEQFLNRTNEIKLFKSFFQKKKGLGVVYGRRRIGKSRFLRELVGISKALYGQAVESSQEVQLAQLWNDLFPESTIIPKNWDNFFELIYNEARSGGCKILILDEFPWLVQSEPALPSIIQKWWDQKFERMEFILVCAGSSQRMMHSVFLNGSSPLYGRASLVHKMDSLSLKSFAEFYRKTITPALFEAYSIVGGIPRYWHLADKFSNVLDFADQLYFGSNALLVDEPLRLMWDEGLTGQTPKAILDVVGRGSHRPGEVASRLEVSQGSLGRPLSQLVQSSFLEKDICFGDVPQTSKRVLLKLIDPALMFWFSVFSPLSGRWSVLSDKEKTDFIHKHAGQIWELMWRKKFAASRYWESKIEFDVVKEVGKKSLFIAEVKWSLLKSAEKQKLKDNLHRKFQDSALSREWKLEDCRVIDQQDLEEIATDH